MDSCRSVNVGRGSKRGSRGFQRFCLSNWRNGVSIPGMERASGGVCWGAVKSSSSSCSEFGAEVQVNDAQ